MSRLELFMARRLFGLPAGIKVRLSGRPAVKVDGQTLHPEMQLLLAAREWRHVGTLRAETAERSRERLRREVLRYRAAPARVGDVRNVTVGGGAGALPARHYAPAQAGGPHPLLVYFHGGGFVAGDLDTADSPCRSLCREAGVHVLSVDYRLAPEHPFPAAIEDGRAALRWAQAHAAELGADPGRVGVGGDSAGANLTAVVSQLAVREGGPAPALQLLIYPPTDRTVDHPSMKLFADGFILTRADVRWYDDQYLGDRRALLGDPRVSPLRAPSLAGLPPALIYTAGFDPLRDEGEAYAAALSAAGTPATIRRFEGLLHGFVNMTAVSRAAREAMSEIAAAVRAAWKNA
jgi:acetyl esterase